MDERTHARMRQILLERLAVRSPNGEDMPNMFAGFSWTWKRHQRIRNVLHVTFSDLRAFRVIRIQARKLKRKDCRLQFIQAGIHSFAQIHILLFATVIGKSADRLRKFRIRSRDSTGIAKRSQIFTRVKTKTGRIAKRSCTLVIFYSTVPLSGIFY